jgi:hypothetical protein
MLLVNNQFDAEGLSACFQTSWCKSNLFPSGVIAYQTWFQHRTAQIHWLKVCGLFVRMALHARKVPCITKALVRFRTIWTLLAKQVASEAKYFSFSHFTQSEYCHRQVFCCI